MPVVDPMQKRVRFKIVYCGAPLGGKTTSLQSLHRHLDPRRRGDLVSLSTATDRTLFFDFLSVDSAPPPGWQASFQLYTVPGQITSNATLRLVLEQADGLVFVADSLLDRQRDNLEAWRNLKANLASLGQDPDRMPLALQYTKRDLPGAAPLEYLEFLFNREAVPRTGFEVDAREGEQAVAVLEHVARQVLAAFVAREKSKNADARDPLPG